MYRESHAIQSWMTCQSDTNCVFQSGQEVQRSLMTFSCSPLNFRCVCVTCDVMSLGATAVWIVTSPNFSRIDLEKKLLSPAHSLTSSAFCHYSLTSCCVPVALCELPLAALIEPMTSTLCRKLKHFVWNARFYARLVYVLCGLSFYLLIKKSRLCNLFRKTTASLCAVNHLNVV